MRGISTRRDQLLQLLALLVYGGVVIRTAWLAEDAFITFRTVDNFIHGYGLTWNIAERVQAYTNPLWLFLVSFFYFFTREIYYTSIFLSLTVSLLAVLVFSLRISASTRATLLAAAILISSKAFTDYSTSGMENPLTHLLLAVFAAVYLRGEGDERWLFALALIAGLGALNRMDAVLLFLPAVVYSLWPMRSAKNLGIVLAGFAPIILWELFSLFYYGFVFPNTAYAKLATGVPAAERMRHGLFYLLNSLQIDPLTLVVTLVGIAVPVVHGARRQVPLAAGGVLYLIYVVAIGGGFMSGRFLAAPFWCSVLLICRHFPFSSRRIWAAALCAALLVGWLSPYTPYSSGGDYKPEKAREHLDERGNFYQNTGLLKALAKAPGEEFPDHWWAARARAVRRGNLRPQISKDRVEGALIVPAEGDSTIVAAWTNVGFSGFYAGPRVHIVDAIALAEPLLARLPARLDPKTGAGHYGRIMPEGYLETHVSGRNQIADENLAAYYEKLRLVIRGDLFDPQRLREIWNFGRGKYDDLIDFDSYRFPSALEVALSETRIEPVNPAAHIEAGKEYFKTGEGEKAIAHLNTALQSNPLSFTNCFIVGRTYAAQNQAELARAAFRQAIQNRAAYLRDLEAEGVEDPLLQGYIKVALAYAGAGEEANKEALLGIFRQILARDFPQADSKLYTRMGFFFFQKGEIEDSIQAYRKALEKSERNTTARVNLGWNLYLKGDWEGAIAEYRTALGQGKNNSAQFNLGLAYLARGDVGKARAAYAQGISEFGVEEAERIGVFDDLADLIERGVQREAAREVLRMFADPRLIREGE